MPYGSVCAYTGNYVFTLNNVTRHIFCIEFLKNKNIKHDNYFEIKLKNKV